MLPATHLRGRAPTRPAGRPARPLGHPARGDRGGLEQRGLAQNLVVVGFGIAFGGVVLAAALAFGLGARDFARELLKHRLGGRLRDQAADYLWHL
ncbi:hypothetical protein [Nitrospira sp. Kam-Ns4a]